MVVGITLSFGPGLGLGSPCVSVGALAVGLQAPSVLVGRDLDGVGVASEPASLVYLAKLAVDWSRLSR